MQIIPRGLLGKWVKYNVNFLYTFFVRPRDDSKDAKSRKDVSFGVTEIKYDI